MLRSSITPEMATNKLTLAVQYADQRLVDSLPRPAIRRWVKAAQFAPAELVIRFVDDSEGRTLNREYRGKDYATNVLTFAYDDAEPAIDNDIVRADIVLCVDVLLREAQEQAISVVQHAGASDRARRAARSGL